jgi:hypothetical protein
MPVFKSERARASWIQAVRVELLSTSGCCWYCGCDLPFAKWATIDHLRPRCRGGPDESDNLRLCCRRCNRRKGARLLESIVVQLGRGRGLFALHDAVRRGLVDEGLIRKESKIE